MVRIFIILAEPGLWSRPVDGGDARQMLEGLSVRDWGNWTLTNEGIYFIDREASDPSIALLDLQTGTIKPIVSLADKTLSFTSGLSVSPDGKQILFRTQEFTTSALRIEQHLHMYDTDTEIISTITDGVGPAYSIGRLAWSPDGTTLAFGGDFRKVESGPVRNPLYFYSPTTGVLTEAIADSVTEWTARLCMM